MQTTPARLIRRLSRDLDDGFDARGTAPDGSRLRRGTQHVYGELTPAGVRQLIRATRLSAADCFVDLGSGTGKVVLQVALEVPGARCIGIEIDSERHRAAAKLLRAAAVEGLVDRRQVSYRHGSMLEARLPRATVLFANSTCFPAVLLAQLARRIAGMRPPLTFVTLQELAAREARPFEGPTIRRCATSWDRRNDMHIYRLVADSSR